VTYECWKLADIPEPNEERVEGYLDGFSGAPRPGANRSPAYRHGWQCGASDKGFVPAEPWQQALAEQQVALHRQSVDHVDQAKVMP
jgi:hypothetical protein